jgi:transposase
MAKRYELTDAQWARFETLLPGKAGDRGRTAKDNRLFVDGVLWVLRSGARWSDLPERYGKRKMAHARFSRRLIADRGYDRNGFRDLIADIGAKAVVPSKSTCRVLIRHDARAYRLRNRIERCFNRLRHFRRIATRYDRRAVHFLAALHLVGALQWLPA